MFRIALVRAFLAVLLLGAGFLVNATGMPGRLIASVQQPGGKIIVVGYAGNTAPFGLLAGRLNDDGTPDPTFGTEGWMGHAIDSSTAGELRVAALAIQPDGKIVVALDRDGHFALMRLNTDGSADESWAPGGILDDFRSDGFRARSIGIQQWGAVIVAGSYTGPETEGYKDIALVRYMPWGMRDEWFSSDGPAGTRLHRFASGDSDVNAMIMGPDDSMTIAGDLQELDADRNMLVARLRWNGDVDEFFGSQGRVVLDVFGDDTAVALAPGLPGDIFVGGRDSQAIDAVPYSRFVVANLGYDGAAYSVRASDLFDGSTFVDARLASVAMIPGTTEVFAAGTTRSYFNGDLNFAIDRTYGFSREQLVAPLRQEQDVLVGAYANNAGAIVAVGTRTNAAGDRPLVVRYRMNPLQLDSESLDPAYDDSPDTIPFQQVSDVGPGGVTVYFESVTVTGINVPTAISIENGEFSIDCSAAGYTSAPSTVAPGQTFCVRSMAQTTPIVDTLTWIRVGDVLTRFVSQTGGPPDAWFFEEPGSPGGSSATFKFATAREVTSIDCTLDGSPVAACASPVTLTGLANGSHTFVVTARNAWGPDPAPASYTWTVFVPLPPDTTITSGLAAFVNVTSASLSFTSNIATATFECSADAGTWTACISPVTLTGLADGAHTFAVRAKGATGTDPTPATRTWTVDTIAPDTTIVDGPSGSDNPDSATFTFTSSEGGPDFECMLDGGVFLACTSPKAYAGLPKGNHTFTVRARDAAGNIDPMPATRNWRSKVSD